MTRPTDEQQPRLGRLRWPYPFQACAEASCRAPLTEDVGAYLFKWLSTDKLVVLCEDCAMEAELHHKDVLLLVAL